MPEPRDPLLKVLIILFVRRLLQLQKGLVWSPLAGGPAEETEGTQNARGGILIGAETPTVMILPQVHLRNGCLERKLIPNISEGARPYLKQLRSESPTTIWPVNSIHGASN
jgi:hypothetical protein